MMRTVAFAVLCAVASVCSATTYYVSTTGSDENNGLSLGTAFSSLAKAVDAAGAEEAEILIAPGTYEQSAAIRVESPLKIRGTGTAASDVTLENTKSEEHVITIAHADAELAFVTLTGGSAKEGPACLGIEAGLVRDCRVTGCSYGCNKNKPGGTVIVSGGRLMRSVVDGNTITGTGWNGVFSAGVRVTAGIVENCLIKGNSARCYNDKGGIETSALSVEGSAQAINCTVVGNTATRNNFDNKPMTTYVASGAKIVNCVIFGNTCEVADYAVWAGTAANYINCVTDSSAAINVTCKTVVDPGFADAANGDYTPTFASPLRDAGSNDCYAGAVSEMDLKGVARILNDTIDVGALEYVPAVGFGVDFSYTVNRRLLPASVTFSAVAENASGTVTYRWDFDSDGNVDLETTEATITHEFSVAKGYDVSVTAISGQETASASKQSVVVPIQKDVYVSLKGSGVYPFATPATAATTIASAIEAAADGCVVYILPDTYTQTSSFTIDKAITLVSTTTNAADVILKNTVSGERVATVSHEGAELAGVTLTGGSALKLGAALTLTAGLVRDCLVTGNVIGDVRTEGGQYGTVCMRGGRLMRCRIAGNAGNASWNPDGAGGVNASSGILDTCLVATNRVGCRGDSYKMALGVKLTGDAKAVNCTIVDNVRTGGDYMMATSASANARFVNCLIWGNVTKEGDEQRYVWNGSAASYVNCYSELTINETSPAIADPKFTDVTSGDYSLTAASPLVNKGTGYADASGISEFDIAGNPRKIGKHVDIGCYECQKTPGFYIIVR